LSFQSIPITPPVPFGYKTAWFAIRSTDTAAVARDLEMQDIEPANWDTGVRQAHEYDTYAMFVCPPVQGWTLAVGMPFLWEADDHAIDRMVELSRNFAEVQFFSSMRVSSAYVWARAKDGRIIRHFYDADGTHREVGVATDEEVALDFKFFDASSPDANAPGYWERKDLHFVDESHVLQVAGRWSVDPSKLDQFDLEPSLGLMGTPSMSYPPKPKPIRKREAGLLQRIFGN
jgi:hypothetical protein